MQSARLATPGVVDMAGTLVPRDVRVGSLRSCESSAVLLPFGPLVTWNPASSYIFRVPLCRNEDDIFCPQAYFDMSWGTLDDPAAGVRRSAPRSST